MRPAFLGGLVLAVTVACGSEPAGTAISLLEYRAVAPAEWVARAPSSSMRLAEWSIPGDSAVEIVVYYFGAGQGGSVEANVARWQSQFSIAGGASPDPDVIQLSDPVFPTTVVVLRGDYARGVGTGPTSGTPRPDHILVAAVVETPRGNLFMQMFGPADSATDHRDAFVAFASSLDRLRDGPG